MNSGQIMKWFMEHNELLKVKEDISRRNYLVFLACVLLKIDEEFSYKDEKIMFSSEPMDYTFDEDTELFLNCLNRYLGYSNELYHDLGFAFLKSKNITMFHGKFYDFYDIFSTLENIVLSYKNYDFKKKVYYNGYNTFFYPSDMELTEEEFSLFQKRYTNQSTFEVYRSNGRLVIY